MTTIAVWKTFEIESQLGNPAIWVVGDSRATLKNGSEISTLTDRCAKIFEVDVRVSNGKEILCSTILIAIAGSSTVAHNTIFCVQLTLKYLVGERLPNALELANYVRDIILNITREVAFSIKGNAMCEAIIIARDGLTPKAYTLKAEIKQNNIDYSIEEVCDFPYVIGSDSIKFITFMKEIIEKCENNNEIIDQAPIYAFDRFFVEQNSSLKTGGELHIAAAGRKLVQTYRAMRWNNETGMYEFYVFGMDTFGRKIGDCSIGINPWQLGDKN